MFTENRYASHEHYTRNPRHWDPRSERYSGCDALLTALSRGWTIKQNRILSEKRLLGGQRSTTVFHVDLQHAEAMNARMTIVNTPYMERLIKSMQLQVFQAETLTPIEHPAWSRVGILHVEHHSKKRLSQS